MCEPYMKPTKISGLSLNAGFPASRFRVEHEFGGTSAATSDADGRDPRDDPRVSNLVSIQSGGQLPKYSFFIPG